MRLTLAVVAAIAPVLGTAAQDRPPGAPAATGRNEVRGRVVTTYGSSVAGARVNLSRIDENRLAETREATSDSRGEFAFAGLPAGSYRLAAFKAGFTGRRLSSLVLAATSTPMPIFDDGEVVTLSGADMIRSVDVRLQRAASIAGRIINPDGSAAADIQVGVARRETGGLISMFEARTTSAFDGRYEIADLPPGEYYVGTDPFKFTASPVKITTPLPDPHVTWYPGVRDSDDAETVTLLEGVPAEGVDIWLTPAQRFNVSGRVFWPVGVAVENLTIDFGDPAGTRSGVWYLSDPGGLFTLAGMPAGSLVLLARADSEQGTLLGMATTEVTVDTVEDIRITIDRPGSIEGRVVYDAALRPADVARSIRLVQKLLRVSAVYPETEATIEANGRFHLPNALGEYELALDPEPPTRTVIRLLRNGVPLNPPRVRVAGGEAVEGIEIRVGIKQGG